jgi:hypothetical protein
MFVVCERSKMESINKVSEHFPLWRGAGGGFSSTVKTLLRIIIQTLPITYC